MNLPFNAPVPFATAVQAFELLQHTVLPVGDFLRELQMMGVERMLVPMFAAVIFRPGGRDDDGDG